MPFDWFKCQECAEGNTRDCNLQMRIRGNKCKSFSLCNSLCCFTSLRKAIQFTFACQVLRLTLFPLPIFLTDSDRLCPVPHSPDPLKGQTTFDEHEYLWQVRGLSSTHSNALCLLTKLVPNSLQLQLKGTLSSLSLFLSLTNKKNKTRRVEQSDAKNLWK